MYKINENNLILNAIYQKQTYIALDCQKLIQQIIFNVIIISF